MSRGRTATFKRDPRQIPCMSRSVWLKADDSVGDWEARKHRITAGLEAGVDWVVVDEADVERVRELGDVKIAAYRTDDVQVLDSDDDGSTADAIIVGKNGEGDGTVALPSDFSGSADLTALRRGHADGAFIEIRDVDYESFAEAAAEDATYTIVIGADWQIIPLENLIARIGEDTEIIAGVTTADEAATAFETLEIGADGVLLDSDDPDEIRGAVEARTAAAREQLDLEWAEITTIERTGLADRVCVDTGSLLEHDEGMLVGSMSRGLFFVHAETADSPYVASRPFRVNAGAVHAYIRTPGGQTAYLAELTSGDEVQVSDTAGNTREAVVGRVKIEKRPMFRVQAETDNGDRIETLLQNAETIKVATREGRTPVTDLDPGDEVLVYYEETARHFGEAVDESIIEK